VVGRSGGDREVHQVYLLLPAGYSLSTAGEQELDRLVRGAALPGMRNCNRRGGNAWLFVACEDAEPVRRALQDLAEEHLQPAAAGRSP
jgi:hypothetical protein